MLRHRLLYVIRMLAAQSLLWPLTVRLICNERAAGAGVNRYLLQAKSQLNFIYPHKYGPG